MILIVDDMPTNIQVLAETLRGDYRIKVATSGKMLYQAKQEGRNRICGFA